MGKPTQPHQPGVYRDDPDHDDAASTSSAVLMGDIDYPDEELPSYTDEPDAASVPASGGQVATGGGPTSRFVTYNSVPPELPFSSYNYDSTEIRTRFPDYSINAESLHYMIHEQSLHPPPYFVQLHGTHTETVRDGKKETKNKITDFYIRINITHLLGSPAVGTGRGKMELLPDNKRGYRGGRIPALNPTVEISDAENQLGGLRPWCEAYVENPAGVKTFTFKREVINHDTARLEQLLRSCILETQYRGHLKISFPILHKRVVVCSPGKINEWRNTTWIRWVFYLTFLWIFAWPVLFFLTHKYEVVRAVYPYANVPANDGGNRECVLMSEEEWYLKWASAIQRAALAKMVCKDRPLDDTYRNATTAADARGHEQSQRQPPPTGNAFADGAIGFWREGMRAAQDWNDSRGWGADS